MLEIIFRVGGEMGISVLKSHRHKIYPKKKSSVRSLFYLFIYLFEWSRTRIYERYLQKKFKEHLSNPEN